MREVRSDDSTPSSRESEVKDPEASTEITSLALVSTRLHFLTLLSGLAVRHRMHRHDTASCLNGLNHRFSDISKTGHAQKQWRTQELFRGGRGSTNSVEDRGKRERGSGGGSPLIRGSGGSCNLVQEISFHIVIFH